MLLLIFLAGLVIPDPDGPPFWVAAEEAVMRDGKCERLRTCGASSVSNENAVDEKLRAPRIALGELLRVAERLEQGQIEIEARELIERYGHRFSRPDATLNGKAADQFPEAFSRENDKVVFHTIGQRQTTFLGFLPFH